MTGSGADEHAPHTPVGSSAPQQEETFGLGGRYRREAVAWFDEHQAELRRSAFGDRLLYQAIGLSLVFGVLAYVGGYILRTSTTTEPLSFLGDLLYTLGYALWTGAVVVTLLEVVPRVKQRQVKQAFEAYERARGEAGADRDVRDPGPGPAGDAR